MSFSQMMKYSVLLCDQLERRGVPECGQTVVIRSLEQDAVIAELFH